MALARSASGPGGLSINTSSANQFGSTPPAAGGMFGSAQPSKPSTGLFGATSTSAPQTTTSASGGLFGSTQQPQQIGGLFGNTTSQPQQGGGLFDSTAQSSNPSGQPQQSGGSLFAGSQTQNQLAGGGLFGSSTSQQPAQTGGLFGNVSTQNKPASSSLFGGLGASQNQQAQPQPQQPQQSNLFPTLGQPQQQQTQGPSMFGTINQPLGGSLNRGQNALNQQSQTVPGVRIDTSNIRRTTRFNDLHEDLQKEISRMDDIIQAQIQLKNQCDAIMPAHDSQLASIPVDVDFLKRKLIGVEDALESDAAAIAQARELVKDDAERAKLSFKAVDNLKLPPQYHNPGLWASKSGATGNRSQTNGESDTQDLVGFFSSTADELATTLAKYQKNFSEVEQHLRSVEASSAQQINSAIARRDGNSSSQENPVTELASALTEFEGSILAVAGNVGRTREGIQSLQLGGFMAKPSEKSKNGKRSGVY